MEEDVIQMKVWYVMCVFVCEWLCERMTFASLALQQLWSWMVSHLYVHTE